MSVTGVCLFLAGWFVVAFLLGPLVGRFLSRRGGPR